MSDALRGVYKQFIDSEAGNEFIQWIIALEAQTQLTGYRAKTVEEKALAMAKMEGMYEIRTHLIEMCQPKVTQSKKPIGG